MLKEYKHNYIYFSFTISHDMVPVLVKIGGSNNWEKRIDQHLTSSISYFIICETNSKFPSIERDIKKLYFEKWVMREHYKYDYGMIRDIIKRLNLKFLYVIVPFNLGEEFNFIYKHMEFKEPVMTIGKSKYQIIDKIDYERVEVKNRITTCNNKKEKIITSIKNEKVILSPHNMEDHISKKINIHPVIEYLTTCEFLNDFPKKKAMARELEAKCNEWLIKKGYHEYRLKYNQLSKIYRDQLQNDFIKILEKTGTFYIRKY